MAFVAPLTLVAVPLAALLALHRPGRREAFLALVLLAFVGWGWLSLADGFALFGAAWALLVAGSLAVVLGARPQRVARPVQAGLLTLGLAAAAGVALVGVTSFSFAQLEWLAARHFSTQARLLTSAFAVAAENAPDATRQAVAALEASTLAMADVVARFLPGFLLLQTLVALALAWSLYRAVAREPDGAPLPTLREFRFNDHLIWGVIATLLILVVPRLGLVPLGGSLAAFFGGLYVVRGFAVLLALFGGGGLFAAVMGVLVLLFLLPVAMVVALAFGVTDTWVDWRTRAAAARAK